MSRKIKISETQYDEIYKQINENGENFTAIPNDPKDTRAVASNLASSSSTDDAIIAVGTARDVNSNPSALSGISESKKVNKDNIKSCRRNFINEETDIINYSDFLKQLNK